jgi:hypothetical protein
MTDVRPVLIGLCLLALTSVVVFWRGGVLERRVMTLVVVCWAGCAIAQFATGSAVIPIIVSDLIFACGVLWLILRRHLLWLYLLFAVEALRLLLHAAAFELGMGPTPAYRLGNNVLSTVGLIILAAVALWPKKPAGAAKA